MYGIIDHRVNLIECTTTRAVMQLYRRHLGLYWPVLRHGKAHTQKMKPFFIESPHTGFMRGEF